MADAPPSGGKKFNLRNPGPKEYVITGVAVLGLYLAYTWWKNRSAATAATAANAATPTAAAPAQYGPGPGLASLWLAIQDLQGKTTTTTTTSTPDEPEPAKAGTGTVPHVVGEAGATARAKVSAAGFKPIQVPATTPKGRATVVRSQNPAGGAKAARGTDVALEVAVK